MYKVLGTAQAGWPHRGGPKVSDPCASKQADRRGLASPQGQTSRTGMGLWVRTMAPRKRAMKKHRLVKKHSWEWMGSGPSYGTALAGCEGTPAG